MTGARQAKQSIRTRRCAIIASTDDEIRKGSTHVEQTGDSTGGIVGMEGTKDQMSSERGLNGYLSCFAIANFSHHNDVGVLT